MVAFIRQYLYNSEKKKISDQRLEENKGKRKILDQRLEESKRKYTERSLDQTISE